MIAGAYGRVTSTFRTAARNREVGGVPNSFHLQGRAIDIARRTGVSHREIATALRLAGYELIESLDEGDHSHFAFAGGSAAVQQTTEQTRTLEPPPQPIEPLLLADHHGILQADGSFIADSTIAKATEGPLKASR